MSEGGSDLKVVLLAEQLRRSVPGGIGTYIRGLLQGLRQIDVDVTVYDGRPVPVRILTRAWDLGALAAPRGYDVVHATSLAHPRAHANEKLGITVHDVAWRQVPEAYPPRGRRWHERALRRAFHRSDLLLVPSRETAAALSRGGHGRDQRVHVVPEGSDHLPPPDRDATAALLERHGVRGPFLLTVSTLEPRKNLARLLAAYRQARTRLPEPWPLVVVGPVGWGPALAPEDGVVLTGGVAAAVLAGLYGHEQALALAYVPLVEGFGLPPLEAMAAGLAVLASPIASTGEPGEATLTVDPVDTTAMADALVRVATDDSLRAALADAGRQRASTLTWAEAARAHVRLWEGLVR
jgi:glycosyltransferase involved in cell wall biosynthesis